MLAFRTVTYCTENEETPQRRTEELGRRLVEQEAVSSNSTPRTNSWSKGNELLTAKQQLELALTAAKSSVTAQEQVVVSMLERFSATVPSPDASAKDPVEGAEKMTQRNDKNPTVTGT